MYRRIFFVLVLALATVVTAHSQPAAKKPSREYFQLTIYHFKDSMQEGVLDRYLQNALLPALVKEKITQVGVFKGIGNDTAASKTLYVFVPVRSLKEVVDLQADLAKDAAYQSAGREYLEATFKAPPYTRIESILMEAFPGSPAPQVSKLSGSLKDRVYELRSYESATEKIGLNKIKMFTEGGEIALFDRLGFNAAFYGKVISGGSLPNLMYLTRFENQEARDAHWKAFGSDAEWKKLSALPEYQDNVSHIDIIFVRPTSYSVL